MELVLKEIRNNKKSISIACIQWFITTAISKCTLDIILRFSSTILEYYGDIFMYRLKIAYIRVNKNKVLKKFNFTKMWEVRK